jgi:hypothetical protein
MVHAKKIIIRSKKEDSAFLYHIFEAHEGLAAYSTLAFKPHDQHRDMELLFAEEAEEDLRRVLLEFGDMITILPVRED